MQRDLFCLDGKTAFITGGAGLLGQQHAKALMQIGANVILCDINQQALFEAKERLSSLYPVEVSVCELDITDEAAILDVYTDFKEKNIQIDILVNNAAIDPKVKNDHSLLESSRLEYFSLSDWEHQISVGLTGAFLCSKIFGTPMATRRHGVILNIASDLSVFAPDQRIYRKEGLPEEQQPVKPITYSVIKTGLIGLTKYLAAYWADKQVRVNALSPGGIYTGQGDEFVKKLTDLIPMQRMANKDEYHGAVQFLCSDASKYLTGQNIVMDGGRSIL